MRLHLKPSLGGLKLARLNALDAQELYLPKLGEGISARTVQIVHTTLHKALKQAVRRALVQKNAEANRSICLTVMAGEALAVHPG